MEALKYWAQTQGAALLSTVLKTVIIAVIGILIIRIVMRILNKALEKSKFEKAAFTLIKTLAKTVMGILLALIIYGLGNRTKDPLAGNCISKALRNRLYIDALYDKVLIGGLQQGFAHLIEFLDIFAIRGLICQGLVWITVRIGYLCSWIQCGSLRAYTLVSGIGLVILVLLLAYQF